MKKLFLIALLCALCGSASATDVTVSTQQITQLPFNPTDVGSDQTYTVSVTSGSAVVTTGTPTFPQNIVGKSGFQVSIGGVQYVVASVASRSSLTLTTNYGGLTGSAQLTLYKYVFLRVYANRAFQPLGSSEVVQPGGPGTGQFYKEVGVSIINSGSGNVAWIPEFILPATTDALISNQARYSFVFFRAGGSQLGTYDCGVGRTELQLPPNSPATFAFICNYNSAGGIAPNGQEAYPRSYINEIHPNCTAGQMDYYSITGQKKSCLTVGSGLQISGGVLSATGGGGGGGIGGSGTLNYVPYFTPNGSSLAATNLIYSTASQLFQFGYSVDIQAGGLSKLTLETDQIIFQGGVSRANSAIMQAMKATASQTGPFQRFTDSTGSIKFEVDIDGDVKPRGVNYTWPAVTANGAMLNASGTLSWVPFNSSYFSTSGSIMPKGLAGAINPKTDHACVGDDVADDTTCLTNAITAAVASGGKVIKLDTGTYRTTAKLTIPGGVTIIGDGEDRTIIHGTANDVILDLVAGSGASAFKGPTIQSLGVRGSSSGASQIGIRADDALYFAHVDVQHVTISSTGSHGLYVGNAFSSTFKEIVSGSSLTGYPFLINSPNMPGNHYEKLYPGDVNTTSFAGFRVRAGDFYCVSCNGINVSGSNSWWAIIGDKTGTDGAVSNRSATITCKNCNVESSKAGGIFLYYNSVPYLENTTFAGDGGSSGTWIALKFEVDNSLFPPYFAKGRLDASVTFSSSPASFYANSEPIHANDLPPITVEGNLKIAGGNTITSYRNTSNSRSEKLYRIDANRPLTTITADTTHSNPGADNIEANCALNCTYTMPWPGWFGNEERPIYIRNIGIGTLTVQANAGGSVNGGASYSLAQGESASFMPNSTTLDYRLMGLGGIGAANRVTYWSDTQKLTSSANLTYNGTTFLIQRSGGNPFLAINDISGAGITTRFGPLASAPDRAIIGTTSNHPFGLYANNVERWTIEAAGHFAPGVTNSYDVGSASLKARSGYFGTSLNVGIGSSLTGQIVFSNSGTANTTTLQAGAPASSITFTLPTTLPASAGCLQVGSTGVITQTGSACGGGGGATAWSAITDPGAALSLAMAAYTTTFTWNNATGSSVNLFNLTDTASNTGTGYIFTVGTAASSAAKPVRITAGGTANGVEMTTAGVLQAIGSGGILATTGDSATAFFSAGQIEAARGGTGIDSSGSTGVLRVSAGTWTANAGISHLASSTSADLRGTLSDETGTGAAVFAGGNIGAATATSLNGLTITSTTGTLTIANGKTLTYNNSVALSGTDATTMTFPATTTTLAGLGIAQTFTALQTINPGTTPADGLLFEIGALGGAGTRDSHNLVFRGRSNNGSAHLAEWKQFVDVTANAGTSQFIIGSSLDGGSFTNWLTIADSGDVSLGNIIGSSATFGGAVAADTLSATTSLAVTGTSTMREIDPQTDNTYDLGTTSLRWKTLHVGPGSVVVHNDATNTLKATLGFSGSTAQLITDAATPLKIAVGAGNGIQFATGGGVSVNGVTVSGSSSVFTMAASKTFTVNSTMTLNGTDGTTLTLPGSTTTLAGVSTTQTWTAIQTYNPGTTPQNTILLDIAALSGADATRDSHDITLTGRSRISSVNHTPQWKFFNDVTTSAGISQLTFSHQIDGGGYTPMVIFKDDGTVSATAFEGSGSLLTDLNASELTTGSILHARMPLNVKSVSVCDGTTDDSSSLQSLVNTMVSGDTLSFDGCRSIKLNTQVTIGNGSGTYGGTSSATASTVNDISIEGHNVTVVWGGSSGGPFAVNGPISRVRIRDISVNMGGNAGIAFDLNHPRLSEFENLHIQTMADWAVRIRAYQVWTPGDGANGNTFTGIWGSSTTAGAKGIDVGYTDTCTSCSTHLDVAQNSFRNIRMRFDTGVGTWLASSVGMRLNFTDAGQCEDCIFSAAIALSINVPSGSSGTAYPAGYQFDTTSLQGTASFTTTGTWAAIEKIGFTNYLTADSQTIPVDSNTYGITSTGIRWGFGADAGYISGLQLEWVSTTQVKIKAGSAQIQSTGEIVTLPTDTTIGPSLGANTWYYCYLYTSAGTPSVECVTTAPATAWFGTARSKTSNTARRYIGAIRTNGSSQIYDFYHNPFTGFYQWAEVTTSSPFRVLSSGTATTETSVDCSAVAPATARFAQLRMINTETTGGQNSFIRSRTGGANQLQLRVNSDLITPIALTSAQLFYYIYGGAPTTGGSTFIDVVGFYDLR